MKQITFTFLLGIAIIGTSILLNPLLSTLTGIIGLTLLTTSAILLAANILDEDEKETKEWEAKHNA